MLRDLLRSIFVVEDDAEIYYSKKINPFVKLLSIADTTRDRALYERIVRETREIAEDYLAKGNPLGNAFMAEWFYYQKDASNSLLFHLIASQKGFGDSIDVVKRFKKKGKKDDMHALLLAESYFMIGNDTDGAKWLQRAKKLGFKAADQGFAIRNKGKKRKVESFQDVGCAVDSFIIRLFRNYIIDYSALDPEKHRKCIDFCRGYAFAKGADIQVDDKQCYIDISHGYKERVLEYIQEGSEESEIIAIDSAEKSKEALYALLQGITVVADYTNCPGTEALESFDTLGGACFGLKGELDREDDNVFIFKPKMKEYRGEIS